MAQLPEDPEQVSVASGETDVYATVWTFEEASQVVVAVDHGSGFVELTRGVDYDLQPGDWLNAGADIVFRPGRRPAAGARVARLRRSTIRQDEAFGDLQTFKPLQSERGYDRLTRMVQEERARGERALKVSPGEAGLDLPTVAARAGRLLAFNDDGEVALLDGQDFKGDPGGNVMSVGLFSALGSMTVPAGADLIQTSGYSATGVGAALYAVTASTGATAYRKQSQDGRWFELAEPVITPPMVGANLVSDARPRLQEALTLIGARGGGELLFDDVYSVSPSAPGGKCLVVGSNTRLRAAKYGCGVKVVDNGGNYQTVIGETDPTVAGVEIVDLYIDQNAAGNLTADVLPNVAGKTFAAIQFSGKHHLAKNVTVMNAPGVNTIVFSSSGMQYCRAQGCRVFFRKGATTAAGGIYDNSAFYLNGKDWSLLDCDVFNLSGYGEAITAFEGHGANYIVSRNRARGYTLLANIVGENAPTQAYSNVTVEDNQGYDLRSGIALWALTRSNLKNVSLKGNRVQRDPGLYPASTSFHFGFGLHFGSDAQGEFDLIDSADNFDLCAFYTDATAGSGSAAFQWEAYGNIGLSSRNDRAVGAPNIGHSVYCRGPVPWSGGTAYQVGDYVSQGGANYRCILGHTNQSPPSATYWAAAPDRGVANISIRGPVSQDAGNNTAGLIRQHGILRGVVKGDVLGARVIDTGAALYCPNAWSFNNMAAGSEVYFQPEPSQVANAAGTAPANRGSPYIRGQRTKVLVESSVMAVTTSGGYRNFEVTITALSARTLNVDPGPAPIEKDAVIEVKVIASGVTANFIWGAGFKTAGWVNPTAGQVCIGRFKWDGTHYIQQGAFVAV